MTDPKSQSHHPNPGRRAVIVGILAAAVVEATGMVAVVLRLVRRGRSRPPDSPPTHDKSGVMP